MGSTLVYQKNKRNLSIEILRILSMFLIVLYHTLCGFSVQKNINNCCFEYELSINFILFLVQIAVNIYVLISGYFLVNLNFKINKLIILWLEVVFYSFIIKLVAMFFGIINFSIISLLSCFIPIFTGRYWFVTIYFGLYLLSPFINILVRSLNQRQHTVLNLMLFFLFSFMISIHPRFFGMNSGGAWGLAWFVVLYLWASWFRLYYKPNGKWIFKLLLWVVISSIIALLYSTIELGTVIYTIIGNLYRYDSVFVSILSLVVFIAFLNIDTNKYFGGNIFGKIILFISPSTFGIYLIHTHPEVANFFYSLFNFSEYQDTVYKIFFVICLSILFYFVSMFIDIIRRITIGRIDKSVVIIKICSLLEKYANRFIDILNKRLRC